MRRADAPDVEQRLWAALKRLNERGYHFRRRAVYQSFRLDFVEHDILLAIDLVGGDPGSRFEVRLSPDIAKAHVLASAGYTLLRFWRADLAQNIGTALVPLRQLLEDRPPPPSQV